METSSFLQKHGNYILLFIIVILILYLYYKMFTTSTSTSTSTSLGTGTSTITQLNSTFKQDNTTVSSITTPSQQNVWIVGSRREYSIDVNITPKSTSSPCTIAIYPGNAFSYASLLQYNINMYSLTPSGSTATTAAVYGPQITAVKNDDTGVTLTFTSNNLLTHSLYLTLITQQ